MLTWPGHEDLDEFDSRIDNACKRGRGLAHVPGMRLNGRNNQHGDAFDMDKLDKTLPLLWDEQWRKFMSTEAKMLTELTDEVKAALEVYGNTVKQFRGAVKNDIASAKSAASSIEDNLRRMGLVYNSTAAMLTTAEFEKALVNAERMAAALRAISELQSHSITFAILDKKATP